MRSRVIHPPDLDESRVAHWREIVATRDDLRSPYFAPEFTQSVAQVRSDVRVGLIEQSSRIVGYFPFQAGPLGSARPVGLALSDYHGLIIEPGVEIDPVRLLRDLGLRSFRFDHLLASQQCFAPFVDTDDVSPVMDLREGYEAYCAARRAAGSKQILKLGTLRRKLEREHGELRFELRADPARVLPFVFAQKSRQCIESGGVDIFAYRWTRDLMHRLLEIDTPTFAGTLSALWQGSTLLAAHMGMRSDRVWHYWFPVYEHAFAKYSPGLHLLLEMARACDDLPLYEIDLGKGQSDYKTRLASGHVPICEGRVRVPGLGAQMERLASRFDAWARATPWARPATIPGRLVRRLQYRRRLT